MIMQPTMERRIITSLQTRALRRPGQLVPNLRLGHLALLLVLATRAQCADAAAGTAPATPVAPGQYFRISVVDSATGRGVPCVCLRTVHRVEYWTDSAGEVAFYEPELMGHKVWFSVESYGYSYPTNGFGFTGLQLSAEPGGHAVLKVNRENIAQRIYRCTGEGIYRDSELLGPAAPRDRRAREGAGRGPGRRLDAALPRQIHVELGRYRRRQFPAGRVQEHRRDLRVPGERRPRS